MGVCADPVEAMRNMLADCTWFQAWAGVANAVDAKAKTYVDGLPSPTLPADSLTAAAFAALRPYAIVYPAENESIRLRRDASPNCWSISGRMVVILSRSYSATDTPTTHWAELAAAIEKIVRSGDDNSPGLCEMANLAGYLGIQEIVVDFVGRTPPEARNDYGDAFDVALLIDWGNQ